MYHFTKHRGIYIAFERWNRSIGRILWGYRSSETHYDAERFQIFEVPPWKGVEAVLFLFGGIQCVAGCGKCLQPLHLHCPLIYVRKINISPYSWPITAKSFNFVSISIPRTGFCSYPIGRLVLSSVL